MGKTAIMSYNFVTRINQVYFATVNCVCLPVNDKYVPYLTLHAGIDG